jgi:hypothetical protein
MFFTTQDFAGARGDLGAGGGDSAPLRRFGVWVSYLTTQLVPRIANRREAKYAPPSSRGRGNEAWLAQAAH